MLHSEHRVDVRLEMQTGIIGQHLYSAPGAESGVFRYRHCQNPTRLINFTSGQVDEGVTMCLYSSKFPLSQEQKTEKNLSDSWEDSGE